MSARHLFAVWHAVERCLRQPRPVALFADFDGTLVPIRARPEQARLSAGPRRLLSGIARRGVLVGLVSGRRLDDLCEKVGVRGIWYVGAHGFFVRDPNNRTSVLLNQKEKAAIHEARLALARNLRGLPGIRVEPKGACVAVHYRGAARQEINSGRAVLARLLKRRRELRLLAGKKVWEILPARRVDKWTAVRFILRRESKRGGLGDPAVFYVGDDATDECVFENLDGFSVSVGKRKRTAARFFLRSPAEVRKLLARWARMAR